MAPGLLFVLSEPGPVEETRFHDWYDTEHGPARLALEGVQSGERFRSVDGTRPTWLALYDLDTGVLETPAYRALREQRSARERAIVSKLATLDRRVYSLIDDHGDADGPAPLTIATSLTVAAKAEAELAAWYVEEHIPMLHAIPGWRRTRRFLLRDGRAPRHLALHELTGPEPLDTDAYRVATGTPRRERLMRSVRERERRVFAHYRSFST